MKERLLPDAQLCSDAFLLWVVNGHFGLWDENSAALLLWAANHLLQ